jgi:hypothetical protein
MLALWISVWDFFLLLEYQMSLGWLEWIYATIELYIYFIYSRLSTVFVVSYCLLL